MFLRFALHTPSLAQINCKIRHFSPIAINWFQSSALEPTEMQALPADAAIIRSRPSLRSEAEPREQCIPRRSQGTSTINGGDDREVSKISSNCLATWWKPIDRLDLFWGTRRGLLHSALAWSKPGGSFCQHSFTHLFFHESFCRAWCRNCPFSYGP